MAQLSKEGFYFWKSLPETQALKQMVEEHVQFLRLELVKRLDKTTNPQVQAAFLNGIAWAFDFDNLIQYGEETDAKDGGTSAADKAEARRGAVRGQY